MFGPFTDVMPRALVAGAALWAGASYFVTGPGIAARIASFDYMPACERNHETEARANRERRERELEARTFDPSKDLAADILRELSDSDVIRHVDLLSGGLLGRTIDKTLKQAERGKQAADDIAQDLQRRTATDLAAGGGICGCIGDAAIAEMRTEWAIYTGTLTLVRPAPIQNFGQRMTQIQASGRCAVSVEASR